jgi:hypothetical protein
MQESCLPKACLYRSWSNDAYAFAIVDFSRNAAIVNTQGR